MKSKKKPSGHRKAVLYLRYSSSSQSEQSIEGQERVCREFAKRNKILITGVYIDRAKSASHDTQKRHEFLRMIDDSKSKTFDTVLVYKLDRFARDRYDSAVYKAELKENGVSVLSATESLSEGPEGVILESLLEGMAEYYSLELSQKIQRGINESVEKRKFLGGPIPFGLKVENSRLIPDPLTMKAVQIAYQMALEGWSFTQIMNHLNGLGYRHKGKPLKVSTIRAILHNRKYAGFYVYDGLEVPDVYEKIISPEDFNRVQEMLKMDQKRKKKRNMPEGYLLSGKLFCGCCGGAMIGDSGKGRHGTVYHYYTCYGRKKLKSGCKKKSIRKDVIESFVIEKARAELTDETIKKLAKEMMNLIRQSSPDRLPELKEKKAEIERKLSNAIQAVMNGLASETLNASIKDLEREKKALELQIQGEEENRNPITEDMIVYYLCQIRKGAADSEQSDAALIRAFVDRVVLYDTEDGPSGRVKIIYRLTGESKDFDFSEESFDHCATRSTIRHESELRHTAQGLFLIRYYDLS